MQSCKVANSHTKHRWNIHKAGHFDSKSARECLPSACAMALPAQHEAALEEVWLVAACGLPAGAHLWPIRALEASPLPPPLGPSILAGPSGRVERLLSSGWIGPTYVVTERRESRLGGLPNLTVSAPTDHWTERDWEVAVARICARHIQTIPQMILRHACVTPEAAAVVDEWGSISYAQLVSRAWCVADAIATACVGGDAARGTPPPPWSSKKWSSTMRNVRGWMGGWIGVRGCGVRA